MFVGAPLTGHRIPPGFRQQVVDLFELSLYQGDFWHELARILRPFFWPYTVGSLLGALVLAVIGVPARPRLSDQPPAHQASNS